MNKADEIRDQIRQMRYLIEEKKFIDEMLRKIEDQKNRLQVEELQIKNLLRDSENDKSVTKDIDEEEDEDLEVNTDINFFSSGTPSRPELIEVPIVDCYRLEDNMNHTNNPKAVAETIELDVSKVLLRLASGGNEVEEEQESDDDN